MYALKSGNRQGRINRIAGYRNAQRIARLTVEDRCNPGVFETWLQTCWRSVLHPRDWVILDNATFDQAGRMTPLIESLGAQVVYLPPYSPDLNRIEQCWAGLKSRIRKQLHQSHSLRDAVPTELRKARLEIVLNQAAS